VERATRDKPDLILLDIVMPGMSGFDVLSVLKESEITRSIPVICITGLNSVSDEEKGFRMGAVDYITKPFHQSIVKARIETHLNIVEQIRMIEQLCLFDSLTKAPNRRSFDDHMAIEWGRSMREQTYLSILMIDLDHFKKLNDTFGHQHGDTVLKEVANLIKSTIKRSADFFARWGGEEFTVLLPSTMLNGALALAEAIRAKIEAESSVTVSIGVASMTPSPESSITDFITQADKALYDAKRDGRNRIVFYEHNS